MPVRLFAALCCALLLSACGGGDTVADPIDKYLGTWRGCTPDGTGSALHSVTVGKTGPSSGSLGISRSSFAGSTCTGLGVGTPLVASSAFTLDLEQAQTVSGIVVNVALISLATPYVNPGTGATVSKQTLSLAQGLFFFGLESGSLIDGYPVDLWLPPFARL